MEISENVSLLTSKNADEGCAAFKKLLEASEAAPEVYEHMEYLLSLTEDKSSFVRTRALLLIIANAKWDRLEFIDSSREKLLSHITDEKPITARQFIQSLPSLAAQKPGLRDEIAKRLRNADFSGYKDSLRPLLEKDREKALEKI